MHPIQNFKRITFCLTKSTISKSESIIRVYGLLLRSLNTTLINSFNLATNSDFENFKMAKNLEKHDQPNLQRDYNDLTFLHTHEIKLGVIMPLHTFCGKTNEDSYVEMNKFLKIFSTSKRANDD